MVFLWTVLLQSVLAISRDEIDETASSNALLKCPVRILVVWITSSGEDNSYFKQRRFIIQLIHKFADGTEIYLTTVDGSLNTLLHFKKDSTNSSWLDTIGSHTAGHLKNYKIPFSVISKAVFDFMNKIGNQKIAEEIFFIVNTDSVITDNDVEKVAERLKYKITFVIFTGMIQPPETWRSLATDNRHLFILDNTNEGNETTVVDAVLILCCQDSRLVCDTDEYWTGYRCYKCSHICSTETKEPSEICLEDCPYFGQYSATSDQNVKEENSKSVARYPTFLNTLFQTMIFIFVLILLVAARSLYKFLKRKGFFDSKTDQCPTEEQGNGIRSDGDISLQANRRYIEIYNKRGCSGSRDETVPLIPSEAPVNLPKPSIEKSDMELKVFA